MVAAGTIRTATEDRIIERLADLDGFSATPSDDAWMVSGPPNGPVGARRWIVIGTYDGEFDQEGLQAGADPGIDRWLIQCGLACTDIEDPQAGKAACEAVLNQIADHFATDHRLGLTGLRNVHVSKIDGPYSERVQGKPQLSWINFAIACTADIRRNPS